MKANELRVGNIVDNYYVSPSGKEKKIQNELIVTIKNINNYENFRPIPLTEEWLIKLGFEQKNEFYYVLNDFEIGLSDDDFVENQRTLRYKKAIVLKVKYVHQLQNLFFTLIGEELKID